MAELIMDTLIECPSWWKDDPAEFEDYISRWSHVEKSKTPVEWLERVFDLDPSGIDTDTQTNCARPMFQVIDDLPMADECPGDSEGEEHLWCVQTPAIWEAEPDYDELVGYYDSPLYRELCGFMPDLEFTPDLKPILITFDVIGHGTLSRPEETCQ